MTSRCPEAPHETFPRCSPVISEATAPTVPLLLELAAAPHVARKPEVHKLLLNIHSSREWSQCAADALPQYAHNYTHKVQWEVKAHEAALAGRQTVEGLSFSRDPGVAETAGKLLKALDAEAKE